VAVLFDNGDLWDCYHADVDRIGAPIETLWIKGRATYQALRQRFIDPEEPRGNMTSDGWATFAVNHVQVGVQTVHRLAQIDYLAERVQTIIWEI